MGISNFNESIPPEESSELKSKQILSIVDVLGEGEIAGIEGNLKNIYLNDTPVIAPNGDENFKGLDAYFVNGTQDQPVLNGFNYIENEVAVNLQVKKDNPIIRSITDKNITRVRVTVGVQSLSFTNETNGEISGTEVELVVQTSLQSGGWVTARTVNFVGKTRSQFLRSVILENLPPAPFNIRVVRNTDDSASDYLQNNTLWSSYTEIYDIQLSYPNTALIGMRFDSSQFQNTPRRNYLVKGLLINIPNNYNPITRVYTGTWNGEFKKDWTDNPAWVLYDLITNERYGIGNKLGRIGIDKFQLYTIARYCDVFVPDGYGNEEPRFTCNAYITSQKQAHEVITSICSIFRAMPIWDGTQFTAMQDRKSDPVAIYTNANVVAGKFEYSSTSRKERNNAVQVKYVDKSNNWKGATEYVSEDQLIARNGLKVAKIEAFGCTSRGQAHRIGRWMIFTENLEKSIINFDLHREGMRHLPGDIFVVVDNAMNKVAFGGRIVAVDGNTITLDRDVETVAGDVFTYADKLGKPITVEVQAQVEGNIITLREGIVAEKNTIWSIRKAEAKPKLYRALSFAESKDGIYTVNALEHNPEKEELVDKGGAFDPEDGGILPTGIPPVDNLEIELLSDSDLYQVRITWRVPRTIYDLRFEVKLLFGDKIAGKHIVTETEDRFNGLSLGKYSVSVRGIDKDDKVGLETIATFTIAPPMKPAGLTLIPDLKMVTIKPKAAQGTSFGTQFEFWKGENIDDVIEQKNYLGKGLTMIDTDCLPETVYFYGANAINVVGRSEMIIGNTKTLSEEEKAWAAGGFFRIQTDDGIFPADNNAATQLFYDTFDFNPARDTVLTVYALDGTGEVSHSESKMYDGGKWVAPQLFLDGDLIARGTIRGDRIVAGSEIKAPKINGGEININNRFTVNKDGDVDIVQESGAAGMQIKNNVIKIYDTTGRLTVQIGDLTA